MKISNETKIGSLTAIAIVLLVLGFNFLKGKTFFGKSHNLFAKYTNVQGLATSNAVVINGLQVGTVYSISTDKNMKEILVNMNLTKDVNLPVNSIATIKTSLLGIVSVEIKLGDSKTFIPKNGYIATEASAGIFNDVLSKVDPILYQVTKAVSSIDSVLLSVNRILDPNTKNNISAVLANLNATTANLVGASSSLTTLLNTQTGALAGTLNNLNSFTANLDKNNGKITSMVDNLDKTATNLSQLDLQKTLTVLNTTIGDLNPRVGMLRVTRPGADARSRTAHPGARTVGVSPMDTSHDSALQLKHAGLERQIEQELNRPAPDYATIQSLKKQKLRIKEELEHI